MRAILALSALTIILVIAFVALDPSYQQQREDAAFYARERAALELERERLVLEQERQRAEQLAPVQTLTSAVLTLTVPAVGLLAVLAAFSLGLDAYKARRWKAAYLRPDAAGVLAVHQADLAHVAPAALQAYHQTRAIEAQRPNVPTSLHYAPAFHNRQDSTSPVEAPQLGAPALTLPDHVLLADVLETLPIGKLCYGVLPGNEPLVLTFGQSYHALAAGDTRTGKSNYLDSTIVQLHHQAGRYDLRVLIGDFKREMAATWRRSPLVEAVEVDPGVIADMLLSLAHDDDGILARYSAFERLGNEQNRVIRNIADYGRVTGERPALTFCVIDELNALIEAAEKKDELASALKVVLQTGAGAGVYVLGGAQYLTAKVFGRDGSKQFTTRSLFGAFDQTAAGMVFGQGKIDPASRQLITGAPGRGLIRTAGQAQPAPFQALRCDEQDILGAVRMLTNDAPTVEIPETLKQPGNAPETPETSFTLSPELAQIVRRWKQEGRSKKETISLLWGAKPGGSEAYRLASAAYDGVVGA